MMITSYQRIEINSIKSYIRTFLSAMLHDWKLKWVQSIKGQKDQKRSKIIKISKGQNPRGTQALIRSISRILRYTGNHRIDQKTGLPCYHKGNRESSRGMSDLELLGAPGIAGNRREIGNLARFAGSWGTPAEPARTPGNTRKQVFWVPGNPEFAFLGTFLVRKTWKRAQNKKKRANVPPDLSRSKVHNRT